MSEDRTSEFLTLAQTLAASGIGPPPDNNNNGSSAARPPGTPGQPRHPLSRAPTDIHDNTTLHRTQSAPMRGRYGHDKHATTPDPNDPTTELRHFHTTASEISRDIAAASAMLQELTHLVRRRTLFVDDTDRVNWLVLRIKSSIESLNGRLDEAGATIARSKRRLGNKSQAGQEASNLVEQLNCEFARATKGFKTVLQQRSDGMKEREDRKRGVMDGGGAKASGGDDGELTLGNKPMVYGETDLAGGDNNENDPLLGGSGGGGNSFLQANAAGGGQLGGGGGGGGGAMKGPMLDLTSAVMMGAKAKGNGDEMMSAGEPTGSGSQLPRPSGVTGEGGGSMYSTPNSSSGMRLRHSHSEPLEFSGSTSSIYGQHSEHGHGGHGGPSSQPLTPLEIQRMESESGAEQMMQLIPDQNYLRERADAMETVETNMIELGTIFNKLAVMVNEHREMVTRVEDNVDDANDTINLSLAQLTDTLENLRTNRVLALKVFAVIVVFIILFITFFA